VKACDPGGPQAAIEALRAELERLHQESLRRDEESRSRERNELNARIQRETEAEMVAKNELAKWLVRERFGLATMGVGVAFAMLLTVLPPGADKFVLYLGAFMCVLLGARQKDRAQRKIVMILPRISAGELVQFREKRW
jgi:hypothetical protein